MRATAFEYRLLDEIERRHVPWQLGKPAVRLVWCLNCVRQVQWVPGQDSHLHGCGHSLSPYGPFEERPSFFPTPKPLKPVWWIGNKPKD
jgi:hypothetical protein